jgi:hypothetical protein
MRSLPVVCNAWTAAVRLRAHVHSMAGRLGMLPSRNDKSRVGNVIFPFWLQLSVKTLHFGSNLSVKTLQLRMYTCHTYVHAQWQHSRALQLWVETQ